MRSNVKCSICGMWHYSTEPDKKYTCKTCKGTHEKRVERMQSIMNKVKVILVAQGCYDDYKDNIEKILSSDKLILKYKRFNVMEMLVQLEIERLGWKIKHHCKDRKFNYIYDFYIEEFNIAIEIDEVSHNTPAQKEKDMIRDRNVGMDNMLRIPEVILKGNVKNFGRIVVEKILMQKKYYIGDFTKDKCRKIGIPMDMLFRRR